MKLGGHFNDNLESFPDELTIGRYWARGGKLPSAGTRVQRFKLDGIDVLGKRADRLSWHRLADRNLLIE